MENMNSFRSIVRAIEYEVERQVEVVDNGGKIEQEVECILLSQAINKLPSRDKSIMEFRFGLSGKKEHTQKEVADLMGISQSYISRIEKKILNKLKKDISKTNFF